MEQELYALFSIFLFSVCCHQLMKTLLTPVGFSNSTYTRSALRISKGYRVLAWGIMSMAFMVGVGVSFYQVFSTL